MYCIACIKALYWALQGVEAVMDGGGVVAGGWVGPDGSCRPGLVRLWAG